MQCKGHHGFYIYCHCYRFFLLDKDHEAENWNLLFLLDIPFIRAIPRLFIANNKIFFRKLILDKATI